VKKVYAYEPFKPTFEAALNNYGLNPKFSGKIIAENFGLGFKNETLQANYNPNLKGKNSILNRGFENLETIHMLRADEVIESILKKNTTDKMLVKMDCEGSEYEIFRLFDNKNIPDQIFGFLIEWHNRNPKPIIDNLIKNNFMVHRINYGKLGFLTAFR
jgi:FkbM family methyltransferase